LVLLLIIIQILFFFNWQWEVSSFKSIFSFNSARLYVILSSPSTGKTALINEIIQLSKYHFSPIFINLYNDQFDTSQKVYDSIYLQFNLFFNKYKTILKNILGGQFSFDYFSFNWWLTRWFDYDIINYSEKIILIAINQPSVMQWKKFYLKFLKFL
jgi:AAA+ ATPase superfamily predicted ATPase